MNVCLCVCMCTTMCAVPEEARRGRWIPGLDLQMVVSHQNQTQVLQPVLWTTESSLLTLKPCVFSLPHWERSLVGVISVVVYIRSHLLIFIFFFCVCACVHECGTCMRESWALRSIIRHWWQSPLYADPSHWPFFLNILHKFRVFFSFFVF